MYRKVDSNGKPAMGPDVRQPETEWGTPLAREVLAGTTERDVHIVEGLVRDHAMKEEATLDRLALAAVVRRLIGCRRPAPMPDYRWLSQAAAKGGYRESLKYLHHDDSGWKATNGHVLLMMQGDTDMEHGFYQPVKNAKGRPLPVDRAVGLLYPRVDDVLADFMDSADWKTVSLAECRYRLDQSCGTGSFMSRQDSIRIGDFCYRLQYVWQALALRRAYRKNTVTYMQDGHGILFLNPGQYAETTGADLKYSAIVMPLRL